MHLNSYLLMRDFQRRYVSDSLRRTARLLDVGSMEVQTRQQLLGLPASFRPLWPGVQQYLGVDLAAGPGVDLVLADPYQYQLPADEFDIVISGSTLEHMERPWLAVREMARVLKPGGLLCIITSARWKEHRYPLDCYRFYPDGLRFLIKDAGLADLEVRTSRAWLQGVDIIGIARKDIR
jgi:SAM-dependent methyltransferase